MNKERKPKRGRNAFTDRKIGRPEWLLAPPQAGDFKLLVSVGDGTVVPDDVQSAIDKLIHTVERHDFLVSDDLRSPKWVEDDTCGSNCTGNCGSNCGARTKVIQEGLIDEVG